MAWSKRLGIGTLSRFALLVEIDRTLKKKKIPYTGSEVYHKMLFYILLQRLSGLQIASPHSKRSVVQERLTIFTHTGRWVDGQMWKGLADMMTTVRELLAKLGFM